MGDFDNQNNPKARPMYVLSEFQGDPSYPAGETPSSIHQVYNFDYDAMGRGQTIVVIGAFDYPTALNDFNVFSKQFGLPQETSTDVLAASNQVFQVVYARGSQPAPDELWALEAALDIEWTHAMAPLAKIVLVEAASNTYVDLFQAIDVANAIPGAHVVTMSWGGTEWSGETAFDAFFKAPGMTYVACSGDVGGNTIYPSVSQYVASVGGTKINRNRYGEFIGETGWSGSGGGPSIFVPIPAYQAAQPSVAAKCGLYRGTPDIAFDGDPASGVAIYNSTPYQGRSGWWTIGGTSLSAPCWAGVIACINGRRTEPFTSTADFLTQIYNLGGSEGYPEYFRDIVEGEAGAYSCTVGWDFVTGWGTPDIKNLVRFLR